jgi:alpha-glucosidase (family GH31 glycosyl hydrolase)
MDFIINQE